MFTFTSFGMVDTRSDAHHTLLHVQFGKRYMYYSVNRNRVLSAVMRYSDAEPCPQTSFSVENINILMGFDSNVFIMSDRPSVAPKRITFREACDVSHDRYDMTSMITQMMRPSGYAVMHYNERSKINDRINRVVDSYTRRVDSAYYAGSGSPNLLAQLKGCVFVHGSKLKRMRDEFRIFGAMLAHIKAGGSDHDDDEVGEKFMDLSERYSDGARRAVSEAYDAANIICDGLGITSCDCGHYEWDHDTHDVRDDTWCEQCFNDDAVYCEDINEYWHRDDAYYSDRDDCYYSYDRDEEDDDDDESNNPVMSYSTNVVSMLGTSCTVRSSHFGEFTMGIELEMTSGDNDYTSSAEDVRSRLGSDYCIIKHDGSLPHNGFEVVTVPHDLPTHIGKFKGWDIDPAYRAWNTGKCGMHVHIDSRAFTQMTLGKFLMFINSSGNSDFVRKIAGRHPLVDEQARSYCAAEHQSILSNPKQAVKGKSGERYRMVNLQNLGSREAVRLGLSLDNSYNGRYNTVELRIFRASLKKERLLAQIEFTHASVMFCRVASWRDLNGTSFVKWLKTVTGQYPALVKWYGVRAVHTSQATVIAPAEVTCTDAVPPPPWTPDALTQRHDHHYPFDIPYDTDHNTLRLWAERNYLTYRFATYAGAEYLYFPYGYLNDRICDGDVVYQRVDDEWVLQDPTYAGVLASCAYTATA